MGSEGLCPRALNPRSSAASGRAHLELHARALSFCGAQNFADAAPTSLAGATGPAVAQCPVEADHRGFLGEDRGADGGRAAAQKAVNLLTQSYTGTINDAGKLEKFLSRIHPRMIPVRWDQFIRPYKNCSSKPTNGLLAQDLETVIGNMFTYWRITRNKIGHPPAGVVGMLGAQPFDRLTVSACLHTPPPGFQDGRS